MVIHSSGLLFRNNRLENKYNAVIDQSESSIQQSRVIGCKERHCTIGGDDMFYIMYYLLVTSN